MLLDHNQVAVETTVPTIKHLRETNAEGVDNIDFRFIRESLPAIAFYKAVIINTFTVTGTYLSLWKHGHYNTYFQIRVCRPNELSCHFMRIDIESHLTSTETKLTLTI